MFWSYKKLEKILFLGTEQQAYFILSYIKLTKYPLKLQHSSSSTNISWKFPFRKLSPFPYVSCIFPTFVHTKPVNLPKSFKNHLPVSIGECHTLWIHLRHLGPLKKSPKFLKLTDCLYDDIHFSWQQGAIKRSFWFDGPSKFNFPSPCRSVWKGPYTY